MGKFSKYFNYLATGQFGKISDAMKERTPYIVYHRGGASIFELKQDAFKSLAIEPVFPEGYQCRLAARDEMPACAELSGLKVGEYYRRLRAGDECYGVFEGNRPANINWIHRGSCYVRGMGYLHNGTDRDFYIYGIKTASTEQGKGLYKNCLIEISRYLFGHRAERLIQMVEDGNAPVFHTLPKQGYKETERIYNVTMAGIRRTIVTDLNKNRKTGRIFVKPPEGIFII
jgi:hypothetical protein